MVIIFAPKFLHCSCIITHMSYLPLGGVAVASQAKHHSTSLLQSVFKMATHSMTAHKSAMAAKSTSNHLLTLEAIFVLLSNLATTYEVRGLIKKVSQDLE